MKAIVYRSYGGPDVLKLAEIPQPQPTSHEVLVRIHAASVNPFDWHVMRGEPYFLRLMIGLRAPKVPRIGVDAAGIVERVGSGVTRFSVGDQVFGGCRGSFAEYACGRDSGLAIKPETVTFEQAASSPIAALTALQGLRDKGRIQSGQRVLINGAAGGVGTYAVQFARMSGALVTGVCSTRNTALVESLGASRVVDYTAQDFTTLTDRYDIVLDCIGNHGYAAVRRALTPDGVHVAVGGVTGRWMLGGLASTAGAVLASRVRRQKVVPFVAKPSGDDLSLIARAMAEEKIKPVIDRRYPLSDTAEAVRYVEHGHARGKVVIVP